ncbi:hypothetical protein LPJ60_001950 [Coemansia sp. RSA 2675]|nr:hypothetical protein LPJ60_001950 [Coemansia sp. RSA 2675]
MNNNEGFGHGYGGNQQHNYNNNQQQQNYGYNQQHEQGYNNQYQQQQQQQEYQGYDQQGYQQGHSQQGYGQQDYNQPPVYDRQQSYTQDGRADEHYGYPPEKQGQEYYGEDEGEDGERGLKDKFVNTYVDQYGEEHSKINKTTVGLAAVAVLGGAFLAKKYVDKKKNEENMHRNQEIGGGAGMYDMGGKQHGGGYPSNATMGPYGGGP